MTDNSKLALQTSVVLGTGAWLVVCATTVVALVWYWFPRYVAGVEEIAHNTAAISATCQTEFQGRPASITVPHRAELSNEQWVSRLSESLKVIASQ